MAAAVSRKENVTYGQFLRGKLVPSAAGAPCVCAPAVMLRVQRLCLMLVLVVFSLSA
jgi:hypothetical protein